MTNNRGFQRSERVGQQIHEEVARMFLHDISDPRVQELQITDVDLSPDMRNAKIYYAMLKEDAPVPDDLEEALQGVAGFIRSQLASRLQLRYVPEIRFDYDEAVSRGRRIDDLLLNIGDD